MSRLKLIHCLSLTIKWVHVFKVIKYGNDNLDRVKILNIFLKGESHVDLIAAEIKLKCWGEVQKKYSKVGRSVWCLGRVGRRSAVIRAFTRSSRKIPFNFYTYSQLLLF